jgi:hypothetical protein
MSYSRRAHEVPSWATETVSQYLARTEHLVDPDKYAGTDWEGINDADA